MSLSLLSLLLCAMIVMISPVAGYQATVVIGEVTRRDRSRPMYTLHFPRLGDFETSYNPSEQDVSNDVTTMRVVTAKGQKMRCTLPKTDVSNSSPSTPDDKQHSAEHQFDSIESLLKEYEKKCFLRLEGWWTYEFCYGKHVVQKHIIPKDRDPDDGEKEIEFVLGRYDQDSDLIRRQNPKLVSTEDVAFTQLYVNGSECDTTGKPRQVIVRYLCRDDAVQTGISSSSPQSFSTKRELNILNAIREVESCVYEVDFLNGAICKHPAYKDALAKSDHQIHCSLEHGEGPFEGLHSGYYRKAMLSL